MSHASYAEVRAYAQAQADLSGFDYGLWRSGPEWVFRMLPRKANRTGRELNCEVVSCSILAKCQPGHGPAA